MDLNKTSRFISLILRHRPNTIGISLDEHGWASVEELLAGISEKKHGRRKEVRTVQNRL